MYHKREWLNDLGTHCFSSVEAFHGKMSKDNLLPGDDPDKLVSKFIIHGCHNSVFLHDFSGGTDKLRIVAKMANDFADYLDSLSA